MSNTIQRRQIANEALKILQEHSPLTISMLQTMIEPPIQKKNLRQAMGILMKKNIVNMTPFNSQTFYYQINQSLPVRKEVAKTIKCEGEEVKQKLLRKQDWYHNQWCEFWTLIIKKNFPEAEIVSYILCLMLTSLFTRIRCARGFARMLRIIPTARFKGF